VEAVKIWSGSSTNQDSGYIVVSWTESNDGDITFNHGYRDYWLAKLDKHGVIKWQKTYGGSDADMASSVQITKDNGFIIAGYSASSDGDVTGNHGGFDYWIVKLDEIGNLQWQKSYGGSGIDLARDITLTSDGGFIVAGGASSSDGDLNGNHGYGSDYWIVKCKHSGEIEWQKNYGGSFEDDAFSIQQVSDGGYIITGDAESFNGDVLNHHGTDGNPDAWILKLNNAGTILWQKSMGGTGADYGNVIRAVPDHGYVMASSSYSTDGDVTGNHGDYDYWITKLSADVRLL
jgi:hypothetical protein